LSSEATLKVSVDELSIFTMISELIMYIPKRFFFGQQFLPLLVNLALNLELDLAELRTNKVRSSEDWTV